MIFTQIQSRFKKRKKGKGVTADTVEETVLKAIVLRENGVYDSLPFCGTPFDIHDSLSLSPPPPPPPSIAHPATPCGTHNDVHDSLPSYGTPCDVMTLYPLFSQGTPCVTA